jgi:hypothetical protein
MYIESSNVDYNVEGERFRGCQYCVPELMECFLSRSWSIGCEAWLFTERMADIARVMRVTISAHAAPMAV